MERYSLPGELLERVWRWAAILSTDLAELERTYTSSYALQPRTQKEQLNALAPCSAKDLWKRPPPLRNECVQAWSVRSCVPWDFIAPSVRFVDAHLIPHVARTPDACRALLSFHCKGTESAVLARLPTVKYASFELKGGEDTTLCTALASPRALKFVAFVPEKRADVVMLGAPVFHALSQAHAVTDLCLRNCVIDTQACDALRAVVLATRGLERLVLEGCRMAHTRWLPALRGCPLRHFHIDMSIDGDTLCDVVKTCASTLVHFHIRSPCTPALADALSTCPHLFSLGCGNLCAESTALIERIGSLSVERVSPADLQLLVNASKAPTSLRFENAHLTRTHVHLLCQLIVVNPKVEIRMLGTSVALEDACMLAEVRHTTCPDTRIVLMHQYVGGLNTLPPSHCVFSLFPYMRLVRS